MKKQLNQKRHQKIQAKRNIGIIAHVDAGKTTVTERILYYSGRIHIPGEVHHGATTMDTDDREKSHGITINSAATTVDWREHQINLIDTPGHVDFGIEVKRALRVLDGSVVVFDAVAGVEPQTETNWRMADDFGVARIAFINKMDRPGAEIDRVAEMMRDRLGVVPLPVQIPVVADDHSFTGLIDLVNMRFLRWTDEMGNQMESSGIPANLMEPASKARQFLVETAITQNDELLEAYLADGSEPDTEQLNQCLRTGVFNGAFVPLLCGTALKNRGLQPLLDGVINWLPGPEDRPLPKGIESDDELVAYAFKTVHQGGFGSQTWIRIYSGELTAGDRIFNTTRRKEERTSRLVRMNADREEEIKSASRGDIVAIPGMKVTLTGDTLCRNAASDLVLERLVIPEPVTGVSIEAANRDERDKLGLGLNRLIQEDPTLKISVDSETGQSVLSGMGELHLEMAKEKLENDLGIQVHFGRPQVAYRETIRREKTILVRHRKQGGGPGQFADVEIRFEPLPRGGGFEFISQITGGAIPKEFIPGVEKGIRQAMTNGVVSGFPVVDVRAVLLEGATHETDSSVIAFEVAATQAFREAMADASPVLLEPMMKVHVRTPIESVGDVIGDLNRRRGLVGMQSTQGHLNVVEASVPLSELFGYINDLRSLSSGRADYHMEFDHYAEKAA